MNERCNALVLVLLAGLGSSCREPQARDQCAVDDAAAEIWWSADSLLPGLQGNAVLKGTCIALACGPGSPIATGVLLPVRIEFRAGSDVDTSTVGLASTDEQVAHAEITDRACYLSATIRANAPGKTAIELSAVDPSMPLDSFDLEVATAAKLQVLLRPASTDLTVREGGLFVLEAVASDAQNRPLALDGLNWQLTPPELVRDDSAFLGRPQAPIRLLTATGPGDLAVTASFRNLSANATIHIVGP